MKSRLLSGLLWAAMILLLTGQPSGAGQPGVICGIVLDEATGGPLAGAWVGVIGTNLGAATDSSGKFRIERVLPGSYVLDVSCPGYTGSKGAAIRVEVASGETLQVSVRMVRSTSDQTIPSLNVPSVHEEYRTKSLDPNTSKQNESGFYSPMSNDVNPQIGNMMPPLRDNDKERAYSGAYDVLPDGCVPYKLCFPMSPQDMFFKDYGTNRFVDARDDRFSTFALDVDDASYTLVRRYLQEGNLPPLAAVRAEEFVNHFDYGYNPPADDKFRVFTELALSPFEPDISIMKIGIKGREVSKEKRKPLNLTFVIDVSGSMGRGGRLGLVKRSLEMLVSGLNHHDRVGIVAYGSQAFVVCEPMAPDRARELVDAIRSLYPHGSTYAEAGLRMGYEMALRQYVNGHNNRVILCSDGVANVGRTSADDIMREIARSVRGGITLSCFGFGMGNYNDVLLEQLAQQGNGRYAYINNVDEGRRQFVDDFVGNMEVLARDVKVQVEFNPEVVESYRLVGYENRDVADHRFRDNNQDGGEVGAGHEVTALYELKLRSRRATGKAATVFVRWKNPDQSEVTEISRHVSIESSWGQFHSTRPEFRLAVVAGQFARLLKEPERAKAGYADLIARAESLQQDMPGEQTRELVDLIRRAQSLSGLRIRWFSDETRNEYDRNYRK